MFRPTAAKIMLVLAFTAVVLGTVAPVQRDSDQAAVLCGCLSIAGIGPETDLNFYNFDKQFFAFWTGAAAIRIADVSGFLYSPLEESTVHVTNLTCTLVLVSGMWMCVLVAPRWRWEHVLVATAVLFSPVFLISAPTMSCAIISAGYLLCLVAILSRPSRSPALLLGIALFSFAAVGSRADAVLVMPLLSWGITGRPRVVSMMKDPRIWSMGLAALSALAVGRKLAQGSSALYFPPYFIPKIYVAYLVFGLTGCLIVLGLLVFMLLRAGASRWSSLRAVWYVLGAASLMLPLGYYTLQLYSVRYLTLTGVACLAFAILPRGNALLSLWWLKPAVRWTILCGAVVTLVATVVGLHLPNPRHPRLVIKQSTLFPTSDGLWPMGGVGDFLIRFRSSWREPIDANQGVWLSAQTVDYAALQAPPTEILDTPLAWFIRLAAFLQGVTLSELGDEPAHGARRVVCEERVFLKSWIDVTSKKDLRGDLDWLIDGCKRVASDPEASFNIFVVSDQKVGQACDPEVERSLAIAGVFGGNEFTTTKMPSGVFEVTRADEGKTIVFTSRRGFSVTGRLGTRSYDRQAEPSEYSRPGGGSGILYFVEISGIDLVLRSGDTLKIMDPGDSEVFVSTSVLPAYMAVDKFGTQSSILTGSPDSSEH